MYMTRSHFSIARKRSKAKANHDGPQVSVGRMPSGVIVKSFEAQSQFRRYEILERKPPIVASYLATAAFEIVPLAVEHISLKNTEQSYVLKNIEYKNLY